LSQILFGILQLGGCEDFFKDLCVGKG